MRDECQRSVSMTLLDSDCHVRAGSSVWSVVGGRMSPVLESALTELIFGRGQTVCHSAFPML